MKLKQKASKIRLEGSNVFLLVPVIIITALRVLFFFLYAYPFCTFRLIYSVGLIRMENSIFSSISFFFLWDLLEPQALKEIWWFSWFALVRYTMYMCIYWGNWNTEQAHFCSWKSKELSGKRIEKQILIRNCKTIVYTPVANNFQKNKEFKKLKSPRFKIN